MHAGLTVALSAAVTVTCSRAAADISVGLGGGAQQLARLTSYAVTPQVEASALPAERTTAKVRGMVREIATLGVSTVRLTRGLVPLLALAYALEGPFTGDGSLALWEIVLFVGPLTEGRDSAVAVHAALADPGSAVLVAVARMAVIRHYSFRVPGDDPVARARPRRGTAGRRGRRALRGDRSLPRGARRAGAPNDRPRNSAGQRG